MLDQLRYTYENPHANLRLEHYVYRIGSYHYNWHTDFELFCVVRGRVEVCASSRRALLDEGDLFLINPNEGHASLEAGEGSVAMVLHLDPVFFKGYFEDAEHVAFQLLTDAATRDEAPYRGIRACLAQMMLLRVQGESGPDLAYDAVAYRLASLLVGAASPEVHADASYRVKQAGGGVIEQLVEYIDRNFRSRVTLADLAEQTGYNASYISQLFTEKLGIKFSEYLTRVRLAAATRDLSSTQRRIAEIAADNGFADPKAFNTAFRWTFDKSPSAYRALLSDDARQGDTAFKEQFVAADDPDVAARLAAYRAGGGGDAPDASRASQLCAERAERAREAIARAQRLLDTAERELA